MLFTDSALYKCSILSLLQVSVVPNSLNQQCLLTINFVYVSIDVTR